MSSDEQPPSVPSEPFDELFSLAYRFRCPGNFLPVLGSIELRPLRCGIKASPSPARSRRTLTLQCTLIKTSESPIIVNKLCSTRHVAQSARFRKIRFSCSTGHRRFVNAFPTGKLCNNIRSVKNAALKRYHPWVACKRYPSNTEFPMQRGKCGNAQVSLAIKLLKLNQKRSTIGCRTYHLPLELIAYHTRCSTNPSKHVPAVRVVHASFICYSSEKVLNAGGARLGQHVFICPKKFRSTMIVPVITGTSYQCNVFPILEEKPAVKYCQIVKNVVQSDGTTPVRPQIRVYGASCRTYPTGFVPGDVLQGNRMCGTNPRFKRTDGRFPLTMRAHTGMICRLFPLNSEFGLKRSRCGTIILGTAPILIFGRVWGGITPFFLPPTSGRVGGALQRNK